MPSSGPGGELGVGEPGKFDSEQRCYASVIKHGEGYRMWFTGNGFGATGMGYAEGTAVAPQQGASEPVKRHSTEHGSRAAM